MYFHVSLPRFVVNAAHLGRGVTSLPECCGVCLRTPPSRIWLFASSSLPSHFKAPSHSRHASLMEQEPTPPATNTETTSDNNPSILTTTASTSTLASSSRSSARVRAKVRERDTHTSTTSSSVAQSSPITRASARAQVASPRRTRSTQVDGTTSTTDKSKQAESTDSTARPTKRSVLFYFPTVLYFSSVSAFADFLYVALPSFVTLSF
jgi:hypothetical protein